MPDPNSHVVLPIIFSEDVPASSPCILSWDQQDNGHEWCPTIIIGYYQCRACDALGACTTCVSTVHGKATIPGLCQAHLQIDAAQGQHQQHQEPEEVLR